jgi:hypothetical protein
VGPKRRALAGTSAFVSATSMHLATRMPAEVHAKVQPMHLIAIVLILLIVGTKTARRSAAVKPHVMVKTRKKLAAVQTLNLHDGSLLVRTSTREILFAIQVPIAEIHVQAESRHLHIVVVKK